MIHYNLHCAACGHDFDDWFGGNADWEARKAEYACPACGTARVEKALSAQPRRRQGGLRGRAGLQSVDLRQPRLPDGRRVLEQFQR